MRHIIVPETYNYVGAFLTFGCNLQCSYCLNNQRGSRPKYKHLPYQLWVDGLNRLQVKNGLPITIQGGEPTIYPDFYKLINGIDKRLNLDLLTNGNFDEKEFMDNVSPSRFKRDAPYASIRVSYHLEQMELSPLIRKVRNMLSCGYSVGVWIIEHPRDTKIIKVAQKLMEAEGIDCRLKEFLGVHNGKMYGTYRYPEAVDERTKPCMCKPSELLIAPDGNMHRCHYDLYNNSMAYQHILNGHVKVLSKYKGCDVFGKCNSCDVKLKTNRFQESGYCSVEVKR